MSRTRTRTLRVTALCAAVPVLTACGALTERAMETAVGQIDGIEDVDISRDGDGFSFSTDEGSVSMDGTSGEMVIETDEGTMRSGAATEVPAAITDRLRLPSGFEVTNATELTAPDGTTTAVGGVVPGASMAEVLTDLTTAVEEAGLEVAQRSESEGFSNLVTAEPEGDTGVMVAVVLFSDDAGVNVQLTLTER